MSSFLSYVVHGLAVGFGIALLATGLIIVHRVTRVMNLAQGTFAVVAGLSAATFLDAGLPHGIAEALAVVAAAATGLFTGVVAIGKRGTSPRAALIATLGVGILGYAFEVLVWGDQPRSFEGLSGAFDFGDVTVPRQYVLVAGVTVVVFVLLELFFERTYLGAAMTACASNPYAARLVGIGLTRMGLVAFALGGALGGLAGVLLTPLRPVSFDSDVSLLIDGFASAIIAGLRRPRLALFGGLVLGVSEALVAGYGKASYQSSVALALALAILVVQGARRTTLDAVTE